MDTSETIDVAISFLSQDENKAKELFEVLEERLDVFYYADRQSELVATDGEESFGKVFRDKARVVVVFYRKGWGETVMTRAERSGIKQRANKEGYGFSIWVPLDKDKSIPAFLDPQFIWFDYDRWGINGLSAVIEEKVKKSGLKVRPETVFDRLNKVKKKAELKKAIRKFKWSTEGVKFVKDAENKIEFLIKNKVEQFEKITKEIRFGVNSNRGQISVTTHPFRMNFKVYQRAKNTIDSDIILIELLKDEAQRATYGSNFSRTRKFEFFPTLDEDLNPTWEKKTGSYYSLEALVSYMLEILADLAIHEAENRLKS